MAEYIEAKVTLNRVLFPKSKHQDGDYCIASMYLKEAIEGDIKLDETWETLTVVGNMPKLRTNTVYTLKAEKEYNDKYKSFQYKVKYIGVPMVANTKEGQKLFFEAVLTEKQVESLFEVFDNPLQIIMEENIEALCKVKGIKQKTANDIITKVRNNLDYSTVYIELDKYNLTSNMIKKLVDKYKNPELVVKKIKENPYILATEIEGIGFKKADEIALKGGIAKDSKQRLGAFILHYLREQSITGRSYIPQTELMSNIINALEFSTKNSESMRNLKETIYDLRDKKLLWWDKKKSIMALTYYLNLEFEIATELFRILEGENRFKFDNWKEVIKKIEGKQGWEYTVEQRKGVYTSLEKNLVVITGLAGTGKTTVTNAMTQILDKYSIGQCALSGRASQRISEATGRKASTIHKLLRIQGGLPLNNANNPLDYDIVILDEASMVNLELFLQLLKAIKTGTKLIILGDYGQLSSIGAGNVFMDMLESEVITAVNLTIVHRQAQASAITSKAISIRNQNQLFDRNFEGDTILGELQDLELNIRQDDTNSLAEIVQKFEFHLKRLGDVNKVQIIVPTRQRGVLCCATINEAIQKRYNPHKLEEGIHIQGQKGYKYTLFEGDKIIVTKNKYKVHTADTLEEISIFNGNLGTILKIDLKKLEAVVDIIGIGEVILGLGDLKSVELAYAITCHKLQGSSADTVIVAVDFSGYTLLSCEWLYTAITRAEKYCVLWGLNRAIRTAISKVETKNKTTFLQMALSGAKKEEL